MTRPTFAVALLLVCATTLASGCGGSSSPVRSPSALRRVAARRVVRAMLPTIADYPGYERQVRTVDRSCPSTRSDSGTLAQTGGDAVTLAAGSVTVTGGAAVYSTPAHARTEYEQTLAPAFLHCLVTSLRTSLRAGVVPGVVKTSVSPSSWVTRAARFTSPYRYAITATNTPSPSKSASTESPTRPGHCRSWRGRGGIPPTCFTPSWIVWPSVVDPCFTRPPEPPPHGVGLRAEWSSAYTFR
jgi:hypothetical protein